MNHRWARFMVLVMALCLTVFVMGPAAIAQSQTQQGKYVIVTDGSNIDGNRFIEAVQNGLEAFAQHKGLGKDAYGMYLSDGPGSGQKESKIKQAIEDGATVIILVGYLWFKEDVKIVAKYPNVRFLSFEWTAKSYPDNMINLTFAEEISGFMAGYAVVMDGYRQLGFLGGDKKNASVIRYGYGFVQGANEAATRLNTPVAMKYWYCGSYSPSAEIQARMETWYAKGTEIVFSCGGSIIESCIQAAQNNNAKVVGVDQDQSSLSDTIVTSACKLFDQAVIYMLNLYNAEIQCWPSYLTGSSICLSLAEGTVGLPTDDASWRFASFTLDDYAQIKIDIANGTTTVSDSVKGRPKVKMLKVSYE
ncbi:MAG: BMP family ABC transporter substrate-binding protein [Clostridiales bacterium]|nr:BMP family ABC transporter substrate-binding protein [Clostridiales bacterium]